LVLVGKRGRAKSKVHCSANGGDKPARAFQKPIFPTFNILLSLSCMACFWAVYDGLGMRQIKSWAN